MPPSLGAFTGVVSLRWKEFMGGGALEEKISCLVGRQSLCSSFLGTLASVTVKLLWQPHLLTPGKVQEALNHCRNYRNP